MEGGKEMNANPENLTALVLVSQGQAERHELARMVEEEARCRQETLQIVTVRLRGMGTGISEASKRVPIFSFATQGGKQVSSHFRQRNWVQAREAQIRFPAG